MANKIFDLCCENGHAFEGWFSSVEDFEEQGARGLVSCPVCGSRRIVRRPSASHISSRREPRESPEILQAEAMKDVPEQVRERFEALMAKVRDAAGRAEDVGADFAHEARRIHAGLAPERNIRGLCTPGEAEKLREEGINVLPVPESAGKTLN